MEVQFFFTDVIITLAERIRLKTFLKSLFKREKQSCSSLTYIFCSDEYLLDINKQFLKHDYYTDIITFNLADKNQPVQGELYISIDRVRDNASIQQTSIKEELHRVIFHGALHLCGYKDKKPVDSASMRAAENECLKLYFK